ncbi:MAG TPA: hypothetical protein EYQ73_06155 [Candidatus Poseidoniales archaeon]|jgi:histone H3/H4|nr:MAG: hypothetical protein CXT71_06510 [Euryarchaeota archaeon]HIF46354.1 hypothetical protein [Candidatus Poseidoniales archaeon]HIL64972.1 hypothetical protein [Candidatus Poseidoniales archaeon]
MADMVIVASKFKEMVKSSGCNTGGDAAEAFNHYVHWQIEEACNRAKANGRKTVRSHDFSTMSVSEDSLLVASKVKAVIKANGLNCAADAFYGLNYQLNWVVSSGCNRAVANGRKTIRGHDIVLQ